MDGKGSEIITKKDFTITVICFLHIRQRMLLKLLSNIYKVWVFELFELFTFKFWKFVQFEELFATVSINMDFDNNKKIRGRVLTSILYLVANS